METIVKVVRNSSTINNSFISTVDHLPCDVIRSLWLIQSCNVEAYNAETRIQKLSKQITEASNEEKQKLLQEFLKYKNKITKLQSESLSESEALYNQLVNHKELLSKELKQLDNSTQFSQEIDSSSCEELRNKLIEHYRNNPLQSQREALEEENEKKSLKLYIKVNKNKGVKKRGRPKRVEDLKGSSPKLKLRLQIPRSEKQQNGSDISSNELEVDNNLYCFCKQPSFGDMIGCDNEKSCKNGDWFHYKCVGLRNRVDAMKYITGNEKWYCSEQCKKANESNFKRRDKNKKIK